MKIKLFAFLLILLLISSCGNDDDTTGSFLGTWEATNIDINTCEDFEDDNFSSVQCTDISCYRVVFSNDNTYSFKQGLTTESGTWSADGPILTFCITEDGESFCRTLTGTISASGLRLSEEAQENGCITSYIMVRATEEEDNS